MPRVSVVLAVRDGERHLREALDSVLDQTPSVHELVAVDDGSTDGTPSVLASYGPPLRALRQDAAGYAAALNAGVAASTGELVSFQDADDVWTPGRLATLLDALDEGTDAVFGSLEQFVSPELDATQAARLRFATGPQPATLLQTMVVRRRALLRVGPFDETLMSGANIDWLSRARLAGLVTRRVDEVVLRRRLHLDNMGRDERTEPTAHLLKIMRRHLQRHRDAGLAPGRPDAEPAP